MSHPVIASVRHNKSAVILIAIQLALTLAIICNALFIVSQRLTLMSRPTGLEESQLFTVPVQWQAGTADLKTRIANDLAAVRRVPGVQSAYVSNAFPLSGLGKNAGIKMTAEQKEFTTRAAGYAVDENALDVLGVHLVQGRFFSASDIVDRSDDATEGFPSIVITRQLGKRLFGDQSALGKLIYLDEGPATVIGIVDKMQTPWVSDSWVEQFVENSILKPYRPLSDGYVIVVRTKGPVSDQVTESTGRALVTLSPDRIVRQPLPFSESRHDAYENDVGLVKMLGTFCLVLLGVASFGIVGVTSFWVAQRRRHIGIRRALGATRRDIAALFLLENLFVSSMGIVGGIVITVALNELLISQFEAARMPLTILFVGCVVVALVGQLAALWPSLKAASLPPALATRP